MILSHTMGSGLINCYHYQLHLCCFILCLHFFLTQIVFHFCFSFTALFRYSLSFSSFIVSICIFSLSLWNFYFSNSNWNSNYVMFARSTVCFEKSYDSKIFTSTRVLATLTLLSCLPIADLIFNQKCTAKFINSSFLTHLKPRHSVSQENLWPKTW